MPSSSRLRAAAGLAAAGVIALLGGGCSGSSSSDVAHVDKNGTEHIAITIRGDSVTPDGVTVEVDAGQRIELDVHSNHPAELHAHTGGAGQEFEVHKGMNTFRFTISSPGSYELELHGVDIVVAKLQVS